MKDMKVCALVPDGMVQNARKELTRPRNTARLSLCQATSAGQDTERGLKQQRGQQCKGDLRHARQTLTLLCVAFCFVLLNVSTNAQTTLDFVSLLPMTGTNAFEGGVSEALVRKAQRYMNNRTDLYSPGPTVFQYNHISRDSGSSVKQALSAVSRVEAATFFVSSFERDVVEAISPVVDQLEIVHYSLCPSDGLTTIYPTISQVIPSEGHQGEALAEIVKHFQWDFTVAVMSSSSPYGSNLLSRFIARADQLHISVLSSQQFFPGTQELWHIVQTTKASLARVIVNFMDSTDMRTVVRFADRLDMLSEKYVWLCSDACASKDIFSDPVTGVVDEKLRHKFEGMIGVNYQRGQGEFYERFLQEWQQDDIFQFPGAGRKDTSRFAPYAFDAVLLFAEGFGRALLAPTLVTGETVQQQQKNLTFLGMTGWVQMDETGRNRRPVFDIVNLRRDSLQDNNFSDFVVVGTWNKTRSLLLRERLFNETGIHPSVGDVPLEILDQEIKLHIQLSLDFQFRDGSYDFPDLDIRNSFDYWSCDDRKQKTDETGKTVRLEKPDGKDANNIDIDYRCDEFIDCYNMSDEWGCKVSFPVLFIVYGILLALCVLFAIFCLLFTCLFGFVIKRKRVRAASPTFLIIMCVACIMGYGGLYAFFGQPHTVSCNFRIWFLATAVITGISALLVKSFRVWRLYRSPTEIKALRDWQLVLFVVVSVFPVLVLLALWTGLATPTAMLIESTDDREHLLCSYDGVAGEIGFYVFFFLIVGYIAIFLLFGIFLSVATRNVVSTFNESRLIAISIYNITFSAIVTIPIVFVLRETDPLITWIIIVTAFAYGLTATLVLQFVPKMWGIAARDQFAKDNSSGSADINHASVTSRDSKAIF